MEEKREYKSQRKLERVGSRFQDMEWQRVKLQWQREWELREEEGENERREYKVKKQTDKNEPRDKT